MKLSAGLVVYRRQNSKIEVFLVHPGGPFWTRKDAWGMPKGIYEEGEDSLAAAKREFEEETGQTAPPGQYIELGEAKVSGGKIIKAWAVEGDIDAGHIRSNIITMEWPPRSGKIIKVPEVDKAKWVAIDKAGRRMHKGQEVLIERLAEKLASLDGSGGQSSLF